MRESNAAEKFKQGADQAFFRISKLPEYGLGEIASSVREARLAGKDVIDLSQVNPNLDLPRVALDKLVQACLQPQNHRYSSSQGIGRLRLAAAKWYASRYQCELDPDSEVIVSMGSKEGITHLLAAVLSPGDTVLVPTPAYPIHTSAVFLAGAAFVGVPLFDSLAAGANLELQLSGKSDSFFERLDAAYGRTWPRPRMLVASFPHNPTAATVTADFWERMVEFCLERHLYLVHDFAYGDIAFSPDAAPSILQIPGARKCAVECYSLSKGFSLPGWRIAFLLGCPELVAALKRIKGYLDFGAFQPLQIAAAHLLEQPEADLHSYLGEVTATYEARRDVLCAGLGKLGFRFEAPRASVFVWAELPQSLLASGSRAACQEFLRKSSVAACPGAGFDRDASAWVRFALVEPEHRLRQALKNLEGVC